MADKTRGKPMKHLRILDYVDAVARARSIRKAAAAYKKSKLKCDYYNPEIHAAAFALPQWIKKLVP